MARHKGEDGLTEVHKMRAPNGSLTQEQLNTLRCPTPGCDCTQGQIKSVCHMSDKLIVTYDSATGDLTLLCAECEKLVCRVAVADGREVIFNGSRADA